MEKHPQEKKVKTGAEKEGEQIVKKKNSEGLDTQANFYVSAGLW